jgi:hypothetical protein
MTIPQPCVTKDILLPLLDKLPRHSRVDHVFHDAPVQLLSSEAFGLKRSHRQALDPLSTVKPAKRGEVLLMRQLGEIGAPLPMAASTEEAVDNVFCDGPLPHHMDAMQDLFPMLKHKTKISPLRDGVSTKSYA